MAISTNLFLDTILSKKKALGISIDIYLPIYERVILHKKILVIYYTKSQLQKDCRTLLNVYLNLTL